MSKPKTLSAGAAAAIDAVKALMTLGLRTVRASVLKAELDDFLWGDHARDSKGRLYDLQPAKSAAIVASYAQNGVRPITLTAVRQPDGTAKLTGGRHRVHHLADDALVTVEVIDATPLQTLTLAARSNGEGMGFTMAAAVEEGYATVMLLCDLLKTAGADRTGQLACLPLPKPKAQKAYTADRDGNPFSSHAKRGDAWGPLCYTAEGFAALLGLSHSTAQRVLEILTGLWLMEMDASAVAGMPTDGALHFSRSIASYTRKRGSQPDKPESLAAIKKLAAGIRKGHTVKDAAGNVLTEAPKTADALLTGNITTAKPEPKVEAPKPKRTPYERAAALAVEAAEIIEKYAEEAKAIPSTLTEDHAIQNAFDRIQKATHAIYTAAMEREAAEDDAEEDALSEDAAARLAELKQISA